MNKNIVIALLTSILLTGIGLADTGKTLQEQFDEIRQMNYLNQVGVYFIDPKTNATPKEYTLDMKQEQTQEVTLLMKNDSDKDLHLRVEFSDQQLSNGGNRGCGADYENGFAKFITPSREGDIVIPKKSKMEKIFEIMVPLGVEGLQKGCIAYGVNEDDAMIQDNKENPGIAIKVIKRKVIYIEAVVGGTGFIDYDIAIGKIKKIINDNGDFILALPIENLGNVDAEVSMEGDISDILSYQRPIIASGKILKGESIILSGNVGPLPFYKGLYFISLSVTHKPKFSFNATKVGIDLKIIAGDKKIITTTYFKFHRWILIFVAILIRIIYPSRKKKKPSTIA